MVTEIVYSVLSDNSNRRVTVVEDQPAPTPKAKETTEAPKKRTRKSTPKAASKTTPETGTTPKPKEEPATPALPEGDAIIGCRCPLCGKGTILKGKTAYGCSEWKNGCTFRKPF